MREPAVNESVSEISEAPEENPEETPQETPDETASEPAEITFDEQFYPARPKALRPIARRRQFFAARPSLEFDGLNSTYVDWLRNQSMLGDANTMARQLSGQASMWQNSYARPNPRAAVERSPVWFTAYPPVLHHQRRAVLPFRVGRSRTLGRVQRDRNPGGTAHWTGQAGRWYPRLVPDTQRGRPL